MRIYFSLLLILLLLASCGNEKASGKGPSAVRLIPLVSGDPFSDTVFSGWRSERFGDFTMRIPPEFSLQRNRDSSILRWKNRTIVLRSGDDLEWGVFLPNSDVFRLAGEKEIRRWGAQPWVQLPLPLLDSLPGKMPHHAFILRRDHRLRHFISLPADSLAVRSDLLLRHESGPASLQLYADSLDKFERDVLLKMISSAHCIKTSDSVYLLNFSNGQCGQEVAVEFERTRRIERPAAFSMKKTSEGLEISYGVGAHCGSRIWWGNMELRNDTVFLDASGSSGSTRLYSKEMRTFVPAETTTMCRCAFCVHYTLHFTGNPEDFVFMVEGVPAEKYRPDPVLIEELTEPVEHTD